MELRRVSLTLPAQVLLSAMVIVADWIASNTDLFPLYPVSILDDVPEAPAEPVTQDRAERAWALLDLPARWRPAEVGDDLGAEFRSRFPHIRQPRPFQRTVVDAARRQAGTGLVIVEAPMGWGKTEAAYLAAEVLAGASGAGGCLVALPTQATTDAMFSRTLNWLQALPGAGGKAVTLAHGKASLNDTYAGLLRRGELQSIQDCEDPGCRDPKCPSRNVVAAHEWFRGRKRALLAPFVVCTIDQVLLMALKSRHVMLRHLALAGKVVIIDEVHAYDVYMSRYLYRALHWLGAYRVPVVLLSATLPSARRAELMDAYRSGSGEPAVELGDGYPLVSGSRTGSVVVPVHDAGTAVHLDRLADDLPALIDYLRTQLRDGGCAAVVRNTVTRVQETADALSTVFGADRVTVVHSRFLACDRARREADLVRRFGKPGSGNERDGVRIVVGSQVIEQSLDVDFDLLVSDLAPMDLMLQRLGRLHRHERPRPPALQEPRCAVTGVLDWAAHPVRAIAPARNVYDEHLLLRSAALLHDRAMITLPHDISPLVQHAYADTELGPPAWQPVMRSAAVTSAETSARRVASAETFLLGEATGQDADLVGWQRGGVGDGEDQHGAAQVRDGAESLEVLVVQRDEHGGLLTPDWIGNGAAEQLPPEDVVPYRLAKTVASCALRLPFAMSHNGIVDKVIEHLERDNPAPGFQRTPRLASQLVLALDAERRATVRAGAHTFHLTYDTRRGLLHERA